MGGLPLLYIGNELGLATPAKRNWRVRKGPDGREPYIAPDWPQRQSLI
jgi:hypothetical protein